MCGKPSGPSAGAGGPSFWPPVANTTRAVVQFSDTDAKDSVAFLRYLHLGSSGV